MAIRLEKHTLLDMSGRVCPNVINYGKETPLECGQYCFLWMRGRAKERALIFR